MFLVAPTSAPESADMEQNSVTKGAYILRAAGCVACHTDLNRGGAYLAGGPALKTKFGTFWGPNITPDPEAGLGNWSLDDFRKAMTEGLAPDGSHYYPVFPYTSYTKMQPSDIDALWAYLQTVPAHPSSTPRHAIDFPYSIRALMSGWKIFAFTKGPLPDDTARSETWNRGRYLTDALGHCGECHTPRRPLGNLRQDRYLAGNPDGPDGEKVPNITPDETGLAGWSVADIVTVLRDGVKPDFDTVQGTMATVITHSTSSLTEDDMAAIATYLISLPPHPSMVHEQ